MILKNGPDITSERRKTVGAEGNNGQRTRRSDRHAGQVPERVDQAAAQMQARQQFSSQMTGGWQNGYATQRQVREQQEALQRYYAQQQYNERMQSSWKTNTGTFQQDGTQRGFVPQQTGAYSTGNGSGNGGKTPKQRSKWLIWVLTVLGVAAICAGLYYLNEKVIQPAAVSRQEEEAVQPFDGLYCNGVYVDGIHLGGMTPEQAYNSVISQIQQRNDAWAVNLTYEGRTVTTITADMLGISADVGAVLNEAWKPGHTDSDGNALNAHDRYEAMLALQQEPVNIYSATPEGDTGLIDSILASIKEQVDVPAQDAALLEFNPSLNYPFVFADEVYGRNLNTEPLTRRLYEMMATLESGDVEIRPDVIEPSVKLVDLKKNYELRSSVYTPISTSSTENRTDNIRTAFSKFNGYVLESGKKFSFNGVVGQRTEKNGFKTAIEYVYGDHVEGVGGGVCQASSTLYKAAVCAGLQIVTREPHSDAVSYCDYGMDATVYWEGKRKIDFVFKNDTDGPIYIVASVQTDPDNKRRLIAKVSIYGLYMEGVRYEMESKIVKVLDPPEKPQYVKDTAGTYVTYKDQQKSVSKAQEGYVVESYRVKYIGNEVYEKKLLYTDEYPAKAEKIYVGVKNRE